MNKLWSIINYSANIILALIIIFLSKLEFITITYVLLGLIMISFLTQLFKEEHSHKFLIISNLILTALFLSVNAYFKKDSLIYIGNACYTLWLIFAFVTDIGLDWQTYPIEEFFNKSPSKKEVSRKKEKNKTTEKTLKEDIKKENMDEDFSNYNLENFSEKPVSEEEEGDDDFQIQEVGEKIELPYKIFTKKGTITFHREDCRTLKKAKISDLIKLHSLEEAQAYDLKPCRVCKPGE